MIKDYYLGLDMGTSSLGWAVTDCDYNLLRAKGKDLWGVRLFSEAKSAAERRSFRTSRRRRQREQVRIGYLREFFADAINNVDPGFYQRLDDSKYHIEDKNEYQPFSLFSGANFSDKEYYSKYPTIFHLRKELIYSSDEHDVRLVFLAILNMFKHRGHFLNSNLNEEGIGDLKEIYEKLCTSVSLYMEKELPRENIVNVLEDILPSKKYSNSRKVDVILEKITLNKSSDKSFVEMVKLICGLQAKLSVIFNNDNFDEENIKFSISFRDGNYDEKESQAESMLSNEAYDILLILKQLHDWGLLADIMKNDGNTYKFLSEARVASYEKHKIDLSILKNIIKEYAPQEYNSMFRIMSDNNYSSYVGSVNYKHNKINNHNRRGAKCSIEDFYKIIKAILKDVPECENKAYILNEIDKGTFLPKQITSSNGVIPNQLHKAELKTILSNAENYLEFLKHKDESGYTVSEKIIKLFEFQIPYYIGPLMNENNGTGWCVRRDKNSFSAITPWNFNDKIDEKATAEKFIEKMVNHCTYISGETVLPKNSLLYEKFVVLNELNNLKINQEAISVDLKQRLYNDIFKKGKKVKGETVKKYLYNNGYVDKDIEIDITGIDKDFTNTLSNYAKFANILGVDTLTYEQEQMVENIVFWSTVYGDSKKFLKEKIVEKYGDVLSSEQIKKIIGFKFKDWGRLSKEFLELEGANKSTKEKTTIISMMWNENYNLMELLSNNFTYIDEIKKKSSKLEKTLTEIKYEDLDELYISAPVKRMVWQTILVIKDLYKVLKREPKKIFVEMARDVDAPKERKDSRKKKFAMLYKGCKEDGRNWSQEIADKEEREFRSKKLYLYYTQKGRCMYTGERIEISQLINDNLYDIDHIYPRHFVKDDSIENNLVLVKKEFNAHKSDVFPIESNIRTSRYSWWKELRDGGFITEEKFKRLTRNYEFTNEEQASFISRQIVETRQGTKVICDLFEKTFDNAEVIYVKAGNVSAFRQKYDLIKCRDVNDFHHANDAYLNIVVGNTYNVKFTKNPMNFIKEYRKAPDKNQYHMYKLFDYTVRRGDEIAWDSKDSRSISIVKKVMKKNTPLVTRMSYEEHGGIADQTIYTAEEAKKAKGIGYIPIKATDDKLLDVEKYGGFKKYTGTYFFLVEHTGKKGKVRSIEAVPLYMASKLKTKELLEEYCINELGYKEPSVRITKIKMYSLIKVDGCYLYLTGRSNNTLLVANAIEMKLSYDLIMYIKELFKVNLNEKYHGDIISREKNISLYDILTKKHIVSSFSKRPNPIGEKLENARDIFINLDIERQVFVIQQIIQLSKLSNMGADLTYIGQSKKTGVMGINKKINDKREFVVINQSPTGLFEKEIDLLTV